MYYYLKYYINQYYKLTIFIFVIKLIYNRKIIKVQIIIKFSYKYYINF